MLHAHKLYVHECGRSNRYSFGGKILTHIIVVHIVDHGVGGLFIVFSFDDSILLRDSHIQAFDDLP